MIVSINGKPSLPYDADKAVVYAQFPNNAWHGCFGHINITVLDHESAITAYGKHDRVVVFGLITKVWFVVLTMFGNYLCQQSSKC